MKLSMKSRYGLRALIDLSVNSKNEQVALGGIAERNNISPPVSGTGICEP